MRLWKHSINIYYVKCGDRNSVSRVRSLLEMFVMNQCCCWLEQYFSRHFAYGQHAAWFVSNEWFPLKMIRGSLGSFPMPAYSWKGASLKLWGGRNQHRGGGEGMVSTSANWETCIHLNMNYITSPCFHSYIKFSSAHIRIAIFHSLWFPIWESIVLQIWKNMFLYHAGKVHFLCIRPVQNPLTLGVTMLSVLFLYFSWMLFSMWQAR